MLSVLYSGGMMMTDAQISVGDLTSFLLYAGFVGISFGGTVRGNLEGYIFAYDLSHTTHPLTTTYMHTA